MFLHSYSLDLALLQFKFDVGDGGVLCQDMHRPCDGKQDLNLYYFNLEDLVRDMFADPMAEGRQHLYFEMDIGPNGKRRFSDAHTCLVFEESAREFGLGVVILSLVLYIDGT